ncbi:MAG: hypothetical protein Q4G14_13935 [Paracoccus sp. (in: a-proteobacteria)]|uniref:alpha/beta hydrolase-fold protein n=1 Tax=Paracoccus sp. TaxID=267 RepID=UPI0026DF3C5B|nr:hypothetical protein [Paracoccus sp. (in: a-proteobacteria)]MDO5614326.1 hypothetical protein [Paracoccus sp. (in: a-proteobacteria)]
MSRLIPLALTLSCLGLPAVAQQGGPAVNRSVFATETIPSVTAVTQVFGRSQNVTAAIVEYNEPLAADQIEAGQFAVDGRTILAARVTDRPEIDAPATDGRFVVLTLDPEEEAGVIFAPGVDNAPELIVQQTAPVATAAGGTLDTPESGVINTHLINLIVDEFRQFRFTDPETGLLLDYNLFIPQDISGPLPLVLFMHDAGVTGTNPRRTLQQGLGAVAFASAKDQARHPAFVLAPQYPVPLTNDASQTSDYVELTARLIEAIAADYPVDRDRIYATGQSGGCMTSIALNAAHPDLFGGTFCVAGQWDPAVVAPMAGVNFWGLVSEDDAKAFPGMTAIVEELAANGATVTRGTLDAKATPEDMAAAVDAIRAEAADSNVVFTTFTPGSVLPEGGSDNPGAGHVNTWVYAYTIPGIRDWLFAQSR